MYIRAYFSLVLNQSLFLLGSPLNCVSFEPVTFRFAVNLLGGVYHHSPLCVSLFIESSHSQFDFSDPQSAYNKNEIWAIRDFKYNLENLQQCTANKERCRKNDYLTYTESDNLIHKLLLYSLFSLARLYFLLSSCLFSDLLSSLVISRCKPTLFYVLIGGMNNKENSSFVHIIYSHHQQLAHSYIACFMNSGVSDGN